MKATAGERFAMRHFDTTIDVARNKGCLVNDVAVKIDRLLIRERAKVAEDVLAMADADVNIPAAAYYSLEKNVRAKYGKAKR